MKNKKTMSIIVKSIMLLILGTTFNVSPYRTVMIFLLFEFYDYYLKRD